jgi:hypothetical protein
MRRQTFHCVQLDRFDVDSQANDARHLKGKARVRIMFPFFAPRQYPTEAFQSRGTLSSRYEG